LEKTPTVTGAASGALRHPPFSTIIDGRQARKDKMGEVVLSAQLGRSADAPSASVTQIRSAWVRPIILNSQAGVKWPFFVRCLSCWGRRGVGARLAQARFVRPATPAPASPLRAPESLRRLATVRSPIHWCENLAHAHILPGRPQKSALTSPKKYVKNGRSVCQ